MSNKTNLLIVISNLEFGGAQRQVVELVNHLNRLEFNICICSLSGYTPLADQLKPDVELHVIEKQSKFDFSVVPRLARLMREKQIRVAHSYLFDAEIATRLAAAWVGNVAVIGSERNADYRLKPIHKIAYRLTAGMVDKLIANSQRGAEFNARETGLCADKYRVIYNGVNTERFMPANRSEARARLGLDEDVQLIGMFASFKAQKNHPLLLSALEQILPDYPRLKLLLVGDMLYAGMHGSEDYCRGIREQIETGPLANQVIMLGNRDDVENLYPACQFTVLPSLFEGTPNVILESMACGVPVIASRVSDNARIIDDNQDGLLFDSGNKEQLIACIRTLLDDQELTARLGNAARKTAEQRFSSHQLAENTARVYLT